MVLSGHVPQPPLDFITQLAFTAILGSCAFSARERIHQVLAPLAAILFGVYIAALFMRLR